MLHCTPCSLFAWNFQIEGADVPGEVRLHHFTEQGTITLGGKTLQVVKHGWLSGQWSVKQGEETLVTAQKPNPFVRAFVVQERHREYGLAARSPFTRCYDISSANAVVGQICPRHPFTRAATIECDRTVDPLTQIFCFWLAALTWKRAAAKHH